VVAALANRQRRADARQLAVGDPALARELRIGRPDLPREFDDGGLLDLNHIPLVLIGDKFGWDSDDLERFAAARDKLGGFSQLEEIGLLTGIDQRKIGARSTGPASTPS
jgi:hypothetical protein